MPSAISTSAAIVAIAIVASACGSAGSSDPAATKDSAASVGEASATAAASEAPPRASAPSPAPAPSLAPPEPEASTPASSPSARAGSPERGATAKPIASSPPAPSAPAAADPPRGPVAGKPWQLVASADADAGYHCNADYPNKLTTTGGTNVTYPDPKPRGACVGNRVVVNVPIVPTAAGPGTVVGTLSYGICDDAKTSCLIRKKDVSIAFVAGP